MNLEKINIRPCKPNDVNEATPLMYSSGPEAFRYVFSISEKNQVLSFLSYAFQNGNGEFGYKDHFIAESNGVTLGLVGYRKSNDNLKYTVVAAKQIFSYFGFINGLKVITRGLTFEKTVPPPKKGLICLHNFAVNEESRGMGIGSKMIDFIIAKAKTDNYNGLCLDVAATNPKAKQLYLKKGFKVVSIKEANLKNKYGTVCGHETLTLYF